MGPPSAKVRVPHFRLGIVMKQGTNSTPELGVDEIAGSFPGEVRVVQIVVLVEAMKILGEVGGRRKLIDVDVGVRRRGELVVGQSASHHYRNDVIAAMKLIYATRV